MIYQREAHLVKQLVNDYLNQHNKKPTFIELIKDCIYLKGILTASYLFDSLKNGWISNGFKEEDFKVIHKSLFSEDRDYYYTELENYLNNENCDYMPDLTREQVEKSNINNIGIPNIDEVIEERLEIALEHHWCVESYIINVKKEYLDLILLIPDDLNLSLKEKMKTYRRGKLYANQYPNKLFFDEIDEANLIGNTMNTEIISINNSTKEILLKPYNN